jgi:hypothetical protein
MVPSWKIGMYSTISPYSLRPFLLREVQGADFLDRRASSGSTSRSRLPRGRWRDEGLRGRLFSSSMRWVISAAVRAIALLLSIRSAPVRLGSGLSFSVTGAR